MNILLKDTALAPTEAEERARWEAKRIVPTEDPEVLDILARCSTDIAYFCKTFMPQTFRRNFTTQHLEVLALLDDATVPFLAICGFRGFGKTTIGVGKRVRDILFRKVRFVVYVGKTLEYSSGITENIKAELITNPDIREVFGELKAKPYKGTNPAFSKASYFLSDPKDNEPFAVVVPKGVLQPVRGLQQYLGRGLYRPDDFAIDDFEGKEVDNEELRQENWRWLLEDLMPCRDTYEEPDPKTGKWIPDGTPNWNPPWRFTYQDTLKHEDSVMARLLQSGEWMTKRFALAERRVVDGQAKYYSLIPEIMSHAAVQALVRRYRKAGRMDGFYREFMCQALSPENACWTQDLFKYYSEGQLNLNRDPDVERILIVDPAKTANQRSAYSAHLAVGADCRNGKIYFRELSNERLEPEDILNRTFEMALRLNTRIVAVETTGGDDLIKHLFQNERDRRGLDDIEFVWLSGHSIPQGDYGTGKEKPKRARGSMILPYYRLGQIYHEERLRDSALENQELSYPSCTFWDAIDCAGYVPQVLEEGGRYFLAQVQKGDEGYEEFEDDGVDWEAMTRDIDERAWAVN